jgi:hypothetical protein
MGNNVASKVNSLVELLLNRKILSFEKKSCSSINLGINPGEVDNQLITAATPLFWEHISRITRQFDIISPLKKHDEKLLDSMRKSSPEDQGSEFTPLSGLEQGKSILTVGIYDNNQTLEKKRNLIRTRGHKLIGAIMLVNLIESPTTLTKSILSVHEIMFHLYCTNKISQKIYNRYMEEKAELAA